MTPPATNAVINTAELLEAILAHVDIKTLLLSQRTCRSFKSIIADSPTLPRKLWFQPAPQNDTDGSLTFNPFLDTKRLSPILGPGFLVSVYKPGVAFYKPGAAFVISHERRCDILSLSPKPSCLNMLVAQEHASNALTFGIGLRFMGQMHHRVVDNAAGMTFGVLVKLAGERVETI